METLLILTKTWGKDAAGVQWLKDLDAAEPPTVHTTVSSIKGSSNSNGNRLTVEEPALCNNSLGKLVIALCGFLLLQISKKMK